ncbi:hypothetical protein [Frondihabitans australicus]|uniref:Putative membrane protein n=1 Tax=Frondihabitans australicus TaxID=386892 RepID=A0A495IFF6_9MICO|nr:hypothetical protein [Frondihabitans australicus]RKR73925.1 putative membrane protein [Frondihabitans australicus]
MNTALAAAPLAFHGMGPWGYGGHAFFPFFLFVPLFWIAVIVVLAIVFGRRRRRAMAFWAQNGYSPYGGPFGRGFGGPWGGGWGHGGQWAGSGTQQAEQVLADRFARGDIDEVEYRARLEVLRAGQPSFGPQAPYGRPQGPSQQGPSQQGPQGPQGSTPSDPRA